MKMPKQAIRFLAWAPALALLLWPADTMAGGGSSSLKGAMHTLQTMVEIYAVAYRGEYPAKLVQLYQDANRKDRGYWKPIQNLHTEKMDLEGALEEYRTVATRLGKRLTEKYECPGYEGVIFYEPIGKPAKTYKIYGCTPQGLLVGKTRQEKNWLGCSLPPVVEAPFTLTNS